MSEVLSGSSSQAESNKVQAVGLSFTPFFLDSGASLVHAVRGDRVGFAQNMGIVFTSDLALIYAIAGNWYSEVQNPSRFHLFYRGLSLAEATAAIFSNLMLRSGDPELVSAGFKLFAATLSVTLAHSAVRLINSLRGSLDLSF